MKKLITAVVLMLSFAVVSTVPAKAAEFDTADALAAGGMLVSMIGGSGPGALASAMFFAGRQSTKPMPYNLTDACKAETVKASGGNYSYTSYEHCLK